jgi:hypothetical protein
LTTILERELEETAKSKRLRGTVSKSPIASIVQISEVSQREDAADGSVMVLNADQPVSVSLIASGTPAMKAQVLFWCHLLEKRRSRNEAPRAGSRARG